MCIRDSDTLGPSPYQVIFNQSPPREITSLIQFPPMEKEDLAITTIYNRVLHKAELRKKREEKHKTKIIKYNLGEKVLIKNRQLPSSVEGIAKKLLLLYRGPFIITQDKGNNTYELTTPGTNQVKRVFNHAEIKKFYGD